MIHRHNSVSNRIRGGKTEPLPSCHSERVKRAEESSQVANFILWWFFHQRGGFLHSADAAVGMTYRWVVPFCLHGLYLQRFMAMNHRRYIAWYRSTAQVVFGTWRAASSRPYRRSTIQLHGLYSIRCYGDESSPLHCVIPFNRRGYIRYAPGTAHRPFPTVSLVGLIFQPAQFKNVRFLPSADKPEPPSKTQNCQLSIVHCQFK